MGKMKVSLPDELEEEFKTEIAKELGMRRNNFDMALQGAIEMWIEDRKTARSTIAEKAWKTRKARGK
jgi:metal-responsive CopG/Arc/MetJ family transcriptional regulator